MQDLFAVPGVGNPYGEEDGHGEHPRDEQDVTERDCDHTSLVMVESDQSRGGGDRYPSRAAASLSTWSISVETDTLRWAE